LVVGRLGTIGQVMPAALTMPDRSDMQPAADDATRRQDVEAERTLVVLNEQADSMRTELAQLRQKLTELQQEVSSERSIQLREANEKLILAALHADSIADAAVKSLGELARSTQRDTLTDTPNRALMLDRIENALALARRHGTRVAVLFLDLDGFKRVNDTLGHSIGDITLQLAARRLESVVRDSDTVGRHGGDEFLVLMSEISQAPDAALVAEKILVEFAVPAQVGEHEIPLPVSIGIAVFPEDGDDARMLIDRADVAMYHAKSQAGNSFQFYNKVTFSERHPQTRPDFLRLSMLSEESVRAEQNSQMRDLREANEQLVLGALTSQDIQARAEIKQRQQVKFIAIVAHELRNPLNPIRNAAEVLKRVRGDHALLATLQGIIERQVTHMSRLIDDLLDGTRGGVGKLRLQRSTVDVLYSIGVAIDTCRPAVEARRQQLILDLPPGPLNIEGDHLRLAQIFSNLLDNASKYTPEGGNISLAVTTDGDAIVITVADNGIGITPNALPHIFELFVQDERALDQQSGGLGIGLAVVRDLVEAHGGNVVAMSAGKDRGSEFIVRLPLLRISG
jgi:diguanylate cyclase (GGDEF)-like protein